MECNKDEALRAKQIAENKMQSGDFVGGLKLAKKAQRLFPETQNITQIITVCEVHCAAQNKLPTSDMDWYGILQTEKFSEEATIKKQYRKLALLLHPDKNKSAGAEAAFKLIEEAKRVLSDQRQCFLYNTKVRASVGMNNQNGTTPHTTNWYRPPDPEKKFWTLCEHCKTRYEYYMDFKNITLRCKLCSKHFKACDIKNQPSGHTSSPFNSHKDPPNPVPPKEASKSNGGKPRGKGIKDKFAQPSMTKCTAGDGSSGSKVQKNKDGQRAVGVRKAGAGTSNPAKSEAKRSQTPTNVGSKRARQSVSSDSSDGNGNSKKYSNLQENGVDPSGLDTGAHSRRSSRNKKHVSYTETAGGDEFEGASKRPQQDESFKTTKVEKPEVPANGGLFNNASPASFTADMAGRNGEMRNKANVQPEKTVFMNKTKNEPLNPQRKETSNPTIISCPDPEFSDFEKVRKEDCFSHDQYWAMYGFTDCMPRFYARIKKVHSPFKLEYTWLEPNPDGKEESDWYGAGLPVACGKYRLGRTQITRDLAEFSHKVHVIKGSARGSYLVYPMKGETWAIFRHWDIRWSSEPEKNSEYQFEYVEVLSDFDENNGVKVTYLSKVKGFVSLFQQTVQDGIGSFCVPPNELYKFSHQVPSFPMTGSERKDVPKGSFELDPAGLPMSVFQVQDDDPRDVKMNDGTERVPPIIRRSPRSNVKNIGNCQSSTSQYMVREGDDKSTSRRDCSQPEGIEAAACQTNQNLKTPKKPKKTKNHGEILTVRRSPRSKKM